jgi:hypothetical protein
MWALGENVTFFREGESCGGGGGGGGGGLERSDIFIFYSFVSL